ncbi:phage tail protein [Salinicola sp. CPA57]|uniref:phage tail protein n=1 Tax=Salinicola sp. CPA57 TaxID=1949080 RepID=UPI000DA13094|nr:phage tail protein [Salinicola sp. CPA57]
MSIRYKYDINDRRRLEKRLKVGKVEKAMRWSLDAAQSKAAAMISREIRKTYTIKVADVKRTLQIKRARRDAHRALIYTGRRIPLERFSPKPKVVRISATSVNGRVYQTRRKGATVRVRKDKGRQLVGRAGRQSGGWYAKGHVLRRASAKDNRSEPYMQFGPSIPGMVAHPQLLNDTQEMVRKELPKQFSDRLDYLLSQE